MFVDETIIQDLTLLTQDHVHPAYNRKFILSGYRQTNTSFLQCLKYIFIVHNDFGNFWTHFIPTCMFLAWLYDTSHVYNFYDPFWYPLLVYWIAVSFATFLSSLGHALSSKSLLFLASWFKIDYLGISTVILASGLVQYFYERPLEIFLFQYKWTFIISISFLSLNSVFVASIADLMSLEYGYLLRGFSFAIAYIISSLPFIMRLSICLFKSRECLNDTSIYYILFLVFNIMMAFFYSLKFPERYAPGKFDYFFQSHQLFHCSSVGMITCNLYLLQKDALNRQEILTKIPYFQPDVYTTFIPCLLNIVIGSIFILVIIWYMVKNEHYLLGHPIKKTN